MKEIILSCLSKTWLIDVDGVLFVHNSHLKNGDELVTGAKDFLNQISALDKIILLTAREIKYKKVTEDSLKKYDIRYDAIFYDMPHGERILVNDKKPSGLNTAVAINVKRDEMVGVNIVYDKNL